MCVEDKTALHTPVWIDGVKFHRCLINTRAEVNLMFVKDAIKHGLSYETGGNQIIRGFNGGISPVDRITECEMRLGPCSNAKKGGISGDTCYHYTYHLLSYTI